MQETRAYLLAVFVGVLVTAILFSGCTPNRRTTHAMSVPSHATPATATAQVTAVTKQPEVTWAVAAPIAREVQTKPKREKKLPPTMGAGARVIDYELGKKYEISCSEYEIITLRLPVGEQLEVFGSGASGEWPIEGKETGREEPQGVLWIKRYPKAPRTELHVTTDAETYQFILIPSQGGVSKKHSSLILVRNAETEARREERKQARREEAERLRREQAEWRPQENFSRFGRAE